MARLHKPYGRIGGMTLTTTLKLAGGVELPRVGFGTWQLSGRRAYDAIRCALDTGYRHIDTATMYGNEAEVGRALWDSGVPREGVFITTKLPAERAKRARETLDASLRAMDIDAVDLWLIHWPTSARELVPTWEAFLAARADGLARAVGVSNFSTAQIDRITHETGEAPALNQVPWSPFEHSLKVLAGAAGGRGGARRHAGSGGAAVAPAARHRGDPEVRHTRPHQGKFRCVRVQPQR